MARLNLGCGPKWKEQYPNHEGLDIHDYGQEWVCDVLVLPSEMRKRVYKEVIANHFLEHFTWNQNLLIFNAVYILLSIGGKFKIAVPHMDKPRAWIPTHKSYWNEDVGKWFGEEETKVYGWEKWQVDEVVTNERKDLHIWLTKI